MSISKQQNMIKHPYRAIAKAYKVLYSCSTVEQLRIAYKYCDRLEKLLPVECDMFCEQLKYEMIERAKYFKKNSKIVCRSK